jgi:hypothetical protein
MIRSAITTDLVSSLILDERECFLRNTGIVADIASFGEPASKIRDVGIFCGHNADGELRGRGIVWAVERDRRHG